jgi:hypothetical protein
MALLCGGFLPPPTAPQPCRSFWNNTSFFLIVPVVTAIDYGYGPPILLGILLIPPLVGYWLDRRRKASA